MNKKGLELPFATIIKFLIVMIVLIVMIALYAQWYGTGSSLIDRFSFFR